MLHYEMLATVSIYLHIHHSIDAQCSNFKYKRGEDVEFVCRY